MERFVSAASQGIQQRRKTWPAHRNGVPPWPIWFPGRNPFAERIRGRCCLWSV